MSDPGRPENAPSGRPTPAPGRPPTWSGQPGPHQPAPPGSPPPPGQPPGPPGRSGPPPGSASGRGRIVALVLAICLPVGSALGVGAAFLAENLGTGNDATTAHGDPEPDEGGEDSDEGGDSDESEDTPGDYTPEERTVDGRMSAEDWESHGPCGLLTSDELRWITPTTDPDLRVQPVERYVTQRRGGDERSETCQYATSFVGSQYLILSVSQWMPEIRTEDAQVEEVPELGEGATFVAREYSVLLTIPQGDPSMVLRASPPDEESERELSDVRDSMVATARTVVDRLPEKVTYPARSERQLCADVDRKALAEALGSKPALSRSLHSDLAHRCSFRSEARGQEDQRTSLSIAVDPRPSPSALQRLAGGRTTQTVDVTDDLRAFWGTGGLVLRGTGRTVTLQYRSGGEPPVFDSDNPEPPPEELVAVARSVADIYDLRSPGPREPAEDGPCALLTPQEAGGFGYDELLPPAARYVDTTGETTADTCAYDSFSLARVTTSSNLLVQTSAQHFQPIDPGSGELRREPIENVGDEAYLVTNGFRTAAVVRRGENQLTLRAPSLDPSASEERTMLADATRKANERWQPGAGAPQEAPGPCSTLGKEELGSALGSRVTHVRGLSLRPGHRCAYTTANGELLFVDPQRSMSVIMRSRAIDNGEAVDGVHGFSNSESLLVLDRTTPAAVRVTLLAPVRGGFENARIGDRHVEVGKLFSEAFFEG